MSTYRQLKKVREYEMSLRRMSYDVGSLYKVCTTYKHTGISMYYLAQPGELGYARDHTVTVGSIILCVQSGYLAEKPNYPSGTSWPINNFSGLTQGNLFLYDNKIFFISHANTYYDQHLILKEVDLTNDIH